MTSAATRPWRLAGPASGIKAGRPLENSRTSTASPTAKIARVAGAHLVVHADAAGRADLQAGLAGEPRVGPHADGQNHHLGGEPLAILGHHGNGVVRPRLERGHGIAEPQIDALPLEFLLDRARPFRGRPAA